MVAPEDYNYDEESRLSCVFNVFAGIDHRGQCLGHRHRSVDLESIPVCPAGHRPGARLHERGRIGAKARLHAKRPGLASVDRQRRAVLRLRQQRAGCHLQRQCATAHRACLQRSSLAVDRRPPQYQDAARLERQESRHHRRRVHRRLHVSQYSDQATTSPKTSC